MSNKKMGNDFEQELCVLLSDNGFWAHNMANRKNGQPADVIAVKNERAYLIDCKVCENDVFPLSRIEENQHMAMQKWESNGNSQGLFALKTSMGVFMINYGMLDMWEIVHGTKQLNLKDIMSSGFVINDWINIIGDAHEDID